MTGCPSIDLISNTKLKLENNFFEKNKGIGSKITSKENYVVVLQHPNTLEYGEGIFK